MIVARSRPTHAARGGFTLLEVLVVVAILVILASVASVAVFSFMDDAKINRATLDMQTLETAYKAMAISNPDQMGPGNFVDISVLAPKITQGSAGLIDPWNNPYQFRFVPSGETGEERIQFFTYDKKTGNEINWPKR